MRSCLPTLLRVGQAWPTIRFGGYRQFFGFRSPYAGSSVASGRIEFVSPRSRNTTFLRTILSLSVALHEALLARSYFRLLTGSSAREGLSPSCSSALPSAQMSLLTELENYFGPGSTKISPQTGLGWSATFRSLQGAKAGS